MKGNLKLIGTGYFYNLWKGKINEYHGEVYRNESTLMNRLTREPYTYLASTYFIVKHSHDRTTKKLQCSNFEGAVYNKSVWLFKPDRKKAIKILLDYEQCCIAELQARILNHEILIEQLSAMLLEERNGTRSV